MRTFTAIALIACLALSHANTVTISAFDDSAACTAGTTKSSGVTANKLQALSTAVTVDTCTQIGSTGKYVKIAGTSTAPTSFQSHSTSTCSATATEVGQASTYTFTSNAVNVPHLSTNTAVTAASTACTKVTYVAASTSVTLAPYDTADCSTTASTGTTINKFHGGTLTGILTDVCTQVGASSGSYYKIAFTATGVTSFKSYGTDSTCGAGTAVIDVATTTFGWDKCLKLATSNTDVWASGTPYVKLAYTATSTSAKSNSSKLSVCVFAVFAMLIAALF